MQQIHEIKLTYPYITGTLVYQKLIEQGVLQESKASLTTVLRYIKANHLRRQEVAPTDRKAFEMERANDCWQADSSAGPVITVDGRKRKTWLICFLDDASRLVTHGGFFFNDNSVNVQIVFKKAVLKFGVPKRVYVDNGPGYINHQLQWICASLGVVLIHTKPYSPQEKGKCERLFRTIKDTWINGLNWNDYHDLPSLNRALTEFLSQEYNTHVHSVIQTTPVQRWETDIQTVRFLPQDIIEDSFLHRITRRVNNDAAIPINNQLFETPPQYIGQKINLRYSPGEKISVAYIFNEKAMAVCSIYPLNRVENSKVKRQQSIDYSWGVTDV
jgi:hypothetical protein